MDHAHNPYAPSAASLGGSSPKSDTQRAWRNGKILVLSREGDLPDRCVKCNADVDEPTPTRTVYWHHPGFYAFLLINIILYAIVALIARKRVKVAPGLCGAHKKKRSRAIWMAWSGFILGFGSLVAATGEGDSGIAVLLCISLFLLMIVGVFRARIVYASRIDERYVQLKGCGRDFLDSLPEFRPGTRNY